MTGAARNVKLFTIKDKQLDRQVTATKMLERGKGLVVPKSKPLGQQKVGKHLKTYKSSKEDRLHSISASPDQDTFITSDENRVDMWNIERPEDSVYNLVDAEK